MPVFLRQTSIDWVGQTIPRSFWAGAFYASCKARGMQHQAALRALAFKWIRIIYRCWVDRVLYDETRYLLALQKRHALSASGLEFGSPQCQCSTTPFQC